MRKTNLRSRQRSVAIGLAAFAGSSGSVLFAQTTVIYEQNANGQGYTYTAPDGHVITGNFPSNNNWSQSLTDGSYGYSIGPNSYTYPYEDAPSNWSTPTYPNSTSVDVLIPGLPVTLDVSVVVHNLTINASGGVSMLGGTALNIVGPTITDNGEFLVNTTSNGYATILNLSGGTVSGTGSFVLNSNGTSAQLNGSLTQSAAHSIFGFGQINAALTNNGTVNANVSGQTLYLLTSNMSNTALIQSTAGGILEIDGIAVNQSTGGLISATAGSHINLSGTTISGGTLNTSGGAYVYQSGSPDTFSNLTSNAQVDMPGGTTINVTGNFTDNGQILVNPTSNGYATILNLSGGTVSGTGSFVLNSNGTSAQLNGSLTQSAAHSIFGFGQINAALTNNGTVNANVSGQSLVLQTSNMSNNALFTSSNGGTLEVYGITLNQGAAGVISAGIASGINFTNATVNNGVINAANASTMTLNTSVLNNTTFNSAAGATVVVQGGVSSIGSLMQNPAGSVVDIYGGATLNITGSLVDNGLFVVNTTSNGYATILNFSGGTITGSGSFLLNSSTTNAQLNGTLTQPAGHTLGGYGQVNAALTNAGTVNANVSGQTLYLQSSSMNNTGLFEATGGGTLYISGITITQGTGGVISAGSGSTVDLDTVSILGGKFNSSAGTAITIVNGTNLFSSVTNNAQINLNGNTAINVTGNLVDNGEFLVNTTSNGYATILNLSGGTVSGTGSFVLNSNGTSAQLNGSLTQSAAHSIFGFGQINAALTNNGTVNANVSGQTLYLLTSNMSNTALIQSTAGGILEIDGIAVNQSTGGLISATAGSHINLSGTTISGGTLNTSGGAYVYQSGSPDTFSNLTSNAQVDMPGGTTINVTGNFTDNGQILVNPTSNGYATILNLSGGTVSGTGSFVLNSNGTSAQLNGSLTQSAAHSIFGFGQINAALTNNGTVNANVSGQSLVLQTSNMSNNALFTSSNGGTLEVYGITLNQGAAGVISAGIASGINFTNATVNNGVINAANASTMTLNTSVLNNTTFNSAAGATVVVQGGVSSIGSLMQNPAGSVVDIYGGATLNITGSLVDNGLFVVNTTSNGYATILNFSGGTITGSGSFLLNSSTTNAQLNGTLTQPAGHTLGGYGQVNAALTNAGTVNANVSGQTLYLQSSSMNNTGLFEATGGGTLYISGITITQGTGGVISAGSGSTVDLDTVSILGGKFNSSAGTAITIVNGTNLFSSVTNNAQINLNGNTAINVTGNLVDNGEFLVNTTSNGYATILNLSGGTVSGTGSFVLNSNGTSAQLNGSLTQSAAHSIFGFGQINAALTNNGTVNANVSGQTLYLNGTTTGTGNFQVSGGGTLNVAANLTISAPGSLIGAGAGSSILINSGVSLIDNGSVAGLPNITDNGFLTFVANPNTGILTRSLYSLSLGNTATATVGSSSNISNRTLLTTSALNFAGNPGAWGGLLNLGSNDLDVAGGSLTNITSQISEGFHGGNWQGTAGILSSDAASSTTHLFALGAIQNNQSGTSLFTSSHPFDGATPGASDILVKYTYYGDANLDGKVDGSDYSLIDSGYLSHATGWYNGDFNYDGVVNGSDYTLIDNTYNRQGAQLSAELALPTAQVAGAVTSAVPEPAMLGLLALGSLGMLGRRRT